MFEKDALQIKCIIVIIIIIKRLPHVVTYFICKDVTLAVAIYNEELNQSTKIRSENSLLFLNYESFDVEILITI